MRDFVKLGNDQLKEIKRNQYIFPNLYIYIYIHMIIKNKKKQNRKEDSCFATHFPYNEFK